VKAPPKSGPQIKAMLKFAVMIPVHNARNRTATTVATIKRAPDMIPAAPTPATKRPTISISDDIAAPEMAEPISKMKKR
jgi:hypothetical protein